MTVQTLSSITLETIENYRSAASFAVDAYRAGSLRLIDAVNSGLDNNVYPRTSKIAPQWTKAVSQVRGDLSDIIVKGVGEVAARSDKAIELSSTTVADGVSKVAAYAAKIDNAIVVNGLEAAVRFTLPGAQVARTVSAKVAEGADKLARAASGKGAVRKAAASAKKAAATTQRKLVRKAKTVKTAASRKAAAPRKAVAAAKAKAVRATRKVTAAVGA